MHTSPLCKNSKSHFLHTGFFTCYIWGWGRSRCDVADVSYSRWVRKRMYFDISITHNTLHHRGQSRGQRGEETSFILTPAQLHSINIIETDTRFWRLLLMTGKNHSTEKSITGLFYVLIELEK